jgi:G:T-mismatch repair DNA endonuclease (very short patch repair protein)
MKTLIKTAALAAALVTAAFAETPATPTIVPAGGATAIFAGGCFWCIEKDFRKTARRDRGGVGLHRRPHE